MLRFRHSPFVRTLALLLTLNLTLWSCASAPKTATDKVHDGRLYYHPVPVDSVFEVWADRYRRTGLPGHPLVTLTDSAMVSVDGSEPEFHGGEVIELLTDSSIKGDTLLFNGGPPGPGVKHAYVIPFGEIQSLELPLKGDEGGSNAGKIFKTVGIAVVVAAVGILLFSLLLCSGSDDSLYSC